MVEETRDGRRALVTGAAVRVGRSIALELGRAGYDVAIHFHASGEAAASLAAELEALGVEALRLRANLTVPEQIETLFAHVEAEWKSLDLLVNSAAIFPRSPPEVADVEGFDRVVALNLRAPFLCALEARRLMDGRGGSMVNIADVAAFEAWPNYAPYAATKAALVSLTRSLARAWGPAIRVNAVAPGAVLLPDGTSEPERAQAAVRTVLGRVGRPGDVAAAVVFLAGADYVTGEVIRVDGGGHLLRTGDPGY